MPIAARVSPARSTAFDLLMHLETRGSYASELLHSNLLTPLGSTDRALTTELVMGVLRWRMKLDDVLERAGEKSIAKFDLEVKTALRLGAYQLLFLDRIPARAAVNESVELVKLHRKRSAGPLVNAVLRKITADSFQTETVPETAEEIFHRYSHPLWMVERWIQAYGISATRKICEYNQQRPKATMRIIRPSEQTDSIMGELAQEGIVLEPARIVSGAWHVLRGDITQTRAYRQHRLAIQDEASQLAALLAHGQRILDCCAAPGGKSTIATERNAKALVVSMDLHLHRVHLMRELTRSRTVLVADACHLPFAQPFDCVIADLPCTGTGTLSRNPEIKWRLKPEDPARLAKLQLEILRSVARQAKTIVYSTCSLEPEEGEEVIAEFVATDGNFRILPIEARLKDLEKEDAIRADSIKELSHDKFLRTIPGIQECDGFFVAILRAV